MDVKFLSPARDELKLAIEFYEKSSVGLGTRFLNEVKGAISRIVENPQAWGLLDDKIRRCRLQRFPYGIVYAITRCDHNCLSYAFTSPSSVLAKELE